MNVCTDVGNTRIKIALYEGDEVISFFTLNSHENRSGDEYAGLILSMLRKAGIDSPEAENLIYSSVCPEVNQPLLAALEEVFRKKPLRVGAGLKTGLPLKVDNPAEVGNDLVADLVAAKKKYGSPCLVADLGTVSKILLLDKDGAFSACVFMAGLTISAETLFSRAAQLPDISLETPESVLGRNSITAMNSGILYGHADMISGLSRRFEKELGYSCPRILTGGNAARIAPILKDEFVYDRYLCTDGLNELIRRNTKEK